MPSSPSGAWQRLGKLLVQRRIELDSRYRKRTAFAKDAGIHWRLLYDIERAKRESFTPETLAAIEVAYRWRPGSVARVLAGGDPVPIAKEPAAPERAPVPEDDPIVRWVRDMPGLSPGDRETLEGIARVAGLKPHERRGAIGWVLTQWDQRAAENRSA